MNKKKKIDNNRVKTVKSINNNIRSSVRKLNPILRGIVGKKVDIAMRDLQFSERRITKDIRKTIDLLQIDLENDIKKLKSENKINFEYLFKKSLNLLENN